MTARAWSKKIIGPAVVSAVLTATVVTAGVLGTDAPATLTSDSLAGSASAQLNGSEIAKLDAERGTQRASRTARRVTLTPQASDHKFATAPLNIWRQPRERGERLGLIATGTRIAVTGQVVGHWAEVLLDGTKVRWVNADYLADKKPEPVAVASSSTTGGGGGISGAPCPDGSAIEAGLTGYAVAVYRAVCAAFPQPTTYGGRSNHGEHVDGRAIDIMISGSVGWQIANWLRANASALNVREVIFAQQIWTQQRASEGWRGMSDRGSTTANHYDHVHVSVY